MAKHRVLLLCIVVCIVAACSLGFVAATFAAGTQEAPEATASMDPTDMSWFNETGLPIVNEPVSYSLLAPRSATQAEWETLWVFDEMEERTGIRWNITTVDQAGWGEKKSLAFATDELPDFFISGLTQFDVINYGSQGILTPLNDMLNEYAPNILSYFAQNSSIEKSITAPDGNIYMLTGMDTTPRERDLRRFYVNYAWLDNLGLEVPSTLDEFYDVAVAFKEEDANLNGDPNDEIPLGGIYGGYFAMDVPILVAFGYVDPRIDVQDDEVIFVPVQDTYRDYLAFMHKLYDEGLLDPEYFIQTTDQFRAKGSRSLYGAYCYYASWVMASTPADYDQYFMIPPMTSEYNSTQMWPAKDANLFGGYAIVSDTPRKEGLIRLFDYFWTLEGRMMVRVGPESGTWDGEGGFRWATNDAGDKAFEFDVPSQYSSFNEFREQKILPMAIPFGDDGTMAGYFTAKDPRQGKLTNEILTNHRPYYRRGYPYLYFTKDENDRINLLETDIYSYVEQMEAKFIIGDESLSNWDAFVRTVQTMGLDELLEIRQAAYDRWNR